MITLQDMDRINANAVMSPRESLGVPPAIELGDALVHAYIRRNEAGHAVVAVDLNTRGIDSSSVLASPGGVLFELRVNYVNVAGGSVSLDGGRAALARIRSVAL